MQILFYELYWVVSEWDSFYGFTSFPTNAFTNRMEAAKNCKEGFVVLTTSEVLNIIYKTIL